MTTLHDFKVNTIDGEACSLSDFATKTLLVVNVASRCGLTPQYKGMQALYNKYKDRGFEVLGFPCNQFMGQEPGSESEIKDFCSTKFDVSFPMFSKLEVNGDGADPLYAFLTSQETEPDGPGKVAWNFAKFLVDGEGKVVARFHPKVEPEAQEVVSAVETSLG